MRDMGDPTGVVPFLAAQLNSLRGTNVAHLHWEHYSVH
jgi:hypothetical protein